MGTSTNTAAVVFPTREITAQICRELVRQTTSALPGLEAIILTGSLAREEGTFSPRHDGWELLGDGEFLLIFRSKSAIPEAARLSAMCHNVEQALGGTGIGAHIGLAAATADYLRGLEPHIFTYELRSCGRVVWGVRDVVLDIPEFTPDDIEIEDAWRLIENRICELLGVMAGVNGIEVELSGPVQYAVIKLYLDMATSLLVFTGGYAPTYRERTENLRRAAAGQIPVKGWPFPIWEFTKRVEECCRLKLSPMALNPCSWDLWRDAVEAAQRLLCWELEWLTGSSSNARDDELWQRWRRRQRARGRFRGWLYVARSQGWFRSARQWPRWIRLACQSSPRYLIYRAANEVLLELPPILEGSRTAPRWHVALPLYSAAHAEESDWKARAARIARNYDLLLKETRS